MRDFVDRYYHTLFALLLLTIVILSFYVGMLEGKRSGTTGVELRCSESVLTAEAISAPGVPAGAQPTTTTSAVGSTAVIEGATGQFAGSKNGTKYYTPGCAGLGRIKPENIIWFKNAEDATLQGYSAGSC